MMPLPILSNYRRCPDCGKPFPAWRIGNLEAVTAAGGKRSAPDYVFHDDLQCRPCQRLAQST